ncbi:unnamed protein product [Mytilus coruscus]|uniref:Uncharacterized protein n=1 Tax=Mytilus coruscus TaxID=42192 RepID=A0A6J8A7F9_MYTCO|nr:unnamed protein product [Mytilus coruscus]
MAMMNALCLCDPIQQSILHITENATQSSLWDIENPENWTGARFRDELQKLGINIPKSWSKTVLKQLYLDNKERLCTDEIWEGATVAADDHIRQPREILQDPPTDERSSAPSTRMDSVTGNDIRADSNVNNMAALFTSTMVNTLTQCMASMQPSVSHIRPTPDSFTKTYDLANWYEQRNASDVPLIPVSGTTQRTAAHLNFSYSPSTSALPFSHHTSAEMDSTRNGVRSDSFTNVDIVSPNIQRNIIEVGGGIRVNACNLCHQVDHATEFCALQCSDHQGIHVDSNLGYNRSVRPNMPNKLDKQGRSRVFYDGKEVCNNYNNVRGCFRTTCNLLHACSTCRSTGHPAPTCTGKPCLNFKIIVLYFNIDESGKALEREFFISKLKHLLGICGYNPQSFNGHSFRIGAATTAGKSNIEDHLIKTLGRWNSNSYCRYIRTSKNVIKKAQQKLSS